MHCFSDVDKEIKKIKKKIKLTQMDGHVTMWPPVSSDKVATSLCQFFLINVTKMVHSWVN
jgi:hypothetical protein